MPQLSIIIPTKDRELIFRETLMRACKAIAGVEAEIIVVNDSKTQSVNIASELKNVQVINNTGQGVASARNLAASVAQSSLLLFLDDDMWISTELVTKALQLHDEYPQSVFNFNWEYPVELRKQIQQQPFGRFLESIQFTTMKGWCKGMEWHDDKLFPTTGLAGATLLIPSKIYSDVKGYDASFPFAGAEDYDFSVRVTKAGYTAYIYPMIKAWHNEINKTNLQGFLQRTYNNSITRRHAVQIGYDELKINFSSSKKIIFLLIKYIEKPLIAFAEGLPNIRSLDFIYFKLCKAVIAFNIYKGYQQQDH